MSENHVGTTSVDVVRLTIVSDGPWGHIPLSVDFRRVHVDLTGEIVLFDKERQGVLATARSKHADFTVAKVLAWRVVHKPKIQGFKDAFLILRVMPKNFGEAIRSRPESRFIKGESVKTQCPLGVIGKAVVVAVTLCFEVFDQRVEF